MKNGNAERDQNSVRAENWRLITDTVGVSEAKDAELKLYMNR